MSTKELQDRINRLIVTYQTAQLRLISLLGTLEDGLGKRRKEQLLIQVDNIIDQLTDTAVNEQLQIQTMAYQLGVAEQSSNLLSQGIKEIDRSLRPLIHQRAVQATMDESFYSILEASDNMSMDMKQRIENVVRITNQRSLTEGVSRKQATKDAIKELSQINITGMVTSNGSRIPADKYMAGVVQYHQRKAHVVGMENIAIQNNFDLVYINYVGITCDICAQYQGRVYSLSGNDSRFPKLDRRPPFHSNCVHSLSAWVEEYQDPEEVQRLLEESNKPFVDSRTESQIRAYENRQRIKITQNETRKQWLRYKARITDMPSLSTFASHKARGSSLYKELLEDYRKIGEEIKRRGG